MEHYKDYTTRLATYGENWPKNAPVAAEDLAKAGLFYIGWSVMRNGVKYDDLVQCPWCTNKLYNWQSGDSAFGEHMRHFPSCPFIRDKMQEHYESYYKEALIQYHEANWQPSTETEKTELESLKRENERLKFNITCKVCLDAVVGELFLPCAHLVCCVQCSKSMDNCPMCREKIKGRLITFL